MQKMRFINIFIFTLIVISIKAQAAIELRAGYGLNAGEPTSINDRNKRNYSTNALAMPQGSGLTADLIVVIPVTNLLIGARYETLSTSKSETVGSTSYKLNLNQTMTSAIVGYRLLNTMTNFIGLIGTYGLSNTGKYQIEVGSTKTEYTANSNSSYSAGIEGGGKIGSFLIVFETGYQSITGKDIKDNNNNSFSSFDLNVAGFYGKVMVGLTFL